MYPGDSDNLILTGFMGTGKSSAAREIARRLGKKFVDTDEIIQIREGMSVADIFASRGEGHFRRLEASLCHELAAQSGLVIATGGGMLIPDANREILSASGPTICLTASPDEIEQRLEASRDRPLLDGPDRQARIAALLAERSAAYGRIPLQVDTSGLTVAQIADRVLSAARTLTRSIPVRHPSGEYAVHLRRGILAQTGSLLRERNLGKQIALVTDTTVGSLYAERVIESLERAGFQATTFTLPAGEKEKNLDSVKRLYDGFIQAGLDRSSVVLALGGGVIGDMAGFAAATYLRGVPLVQLPTTLLAMVDASVGAKVAVDHRRGKNLIGAFKQPEMVIADPDTLSTLPAAQFANGLAETIKAGIIGDSELFQQLQDHGPAPLPWIIERAIWLKVNVVQDDPYERGRRAVLNLGHTFGHALELLNNYALPHGAGVAIGLAAAARLSARMEVCRAGLVESVESMLTKLGLPRTYQKHTPAQVWQAMATDKKRQGKRLRFLLPRAIGDVFVTDQVSRADVLAVLEELRKS